MSNRRIRISRREFLRDVVDFTAAMGLLAFEPLHALTERSKEISERGGLENYLNFYEPLDPLPTQGTNLRIIGVKHTNETLVDNIEDIRARVQQAPFVFVEYFFDGIRNRARLGVYIDQKMNDGLGYSEGVKFYSGIGRICAQEGKDIIVANPDNEWTGQTELFIQALPTTVAINSLQFFVKNLQGKKITRRSFLRHLILGISALLSATQTGYTRDLRSTLEQASILTSDIPENERADVLGWNLWDYRDIRTAEGIEYALQSFSDETSPEDEVPLFEGSYHNGMLEYLKKPELRQTKRNLYPHYNLVDHDTVRRYTYDPKQDTWILKQELPYGPQALMNDRLLNSVKSLVGKP